MIMIYSFTQQINKSELFNAIAELLHLNYSQAVCMNTGTKTPNTKVAIDYREFENIEDDYKAMVDIYPYDNNYNLKQFNELDFGIKLAQKIKVDLHVLAPTYSLYETIMITSNRDIFSGTEEIYEDKNGEEFIKIENLQKLSHIKIQNLKKEFIKATLKERIGQDESIDRQDKAC